MQFVIQCQSLRRQQVFLAGVAGGLGIKHTDKSLRDGWCQEEIHEIHTVFKPNRVHNLFYR